MFLYVGTSVLANNSFLVGGCRWLPATSLRSTLRVVVGNQLLLYALYCIKCQSHMASQCCKKYHPTSYHKSKMLDDILMKCITGILKCKE